MMYPYAEFLLNFDARHAAFRHHNCPENSRAAIIVETRPLFFLPKVVRNVMYFLGPRWNLHMVCGELSHEYVSRFLRDWTARIVKLQGTYRLSVGDYNKMLTSPEFWQLFTEEKLLIFQSDTLLTGTNIEEFECYDYIGAPCGRFDERFIANGGLSLRSRGLMLKCLREFRAPDGMPEDVFYTESARRAAVRLPDLDTAARFAVESLYTAHPVGVHGTDKCFHSVEVAEKIVRAIAY